MSQRRVVCSRERSIHDRDDALLQLRVALLPLCTWLTQVLLHQVEHRMTLPVRCRFIPWIALLAVQLAIAQTETIALDQTFYSAQATSFQLFASRFYIKFRISSILSERQPYEHFQRCAMMGHDA